MGDARGDFRMELMCDKPDIKRFKRGLWFDWNDDRECNFGKHFINLV